MKIYQANLKLKERKRGFHLITSEILKNALFIKEIKTGLCQIFIQHTSASLTINENADQDVRKDFENYFNKIVPEDKNLYIHNMEGEDDMPAHIKSSILNSSLLIPISNGNLSLGIWQGIYLCEHRNHGGPRNIVITAWGQ